MSAKSIKDLTKILQAHFTAAKSPPSLPPEPRRTIQNFIEENNAKLSDEDYAKVNQELKAFWEKFVASQQKLAIFVGVLKELRPVILGDENIIRWWRLAVRPIVSTTGHDKLAVEDARDFLIGVLVPDNNENDDNTVNPETRSNLLGGFLEIYVLRTRTLSEHDGESAARENAQIAQQIEDILVMLGRKRPKDFFLGIDELLVVAATRLQALSLLSSFLQHQAPHLYLVVDTSLIESILKCLMNDTSTTVLSVALTSLIMLLPHIPGSLGPHLPRMFLVYSRLLCWEKFSPLSTEAEKNLVTDDRLPRNDDDGESEATDDVGIDLYWDKAQPQDGVIEATTPELLIYFTYLYGLYPLNFMSYIRKPRRYLKNIDFPGADAFDLDQAVIRSRTEQFQQVHIVHPNFYNLTIEEELADHKWTKMDPADVVGECHGLCIINRSSPTVPKPTPPVKVPATVPMTPVAARNVKASGQLSPSPSHSSFRSVSSWRDTQSTAVSFTTAGGGSPKLRPHDMTSDQSRTPSKPPGVAVRSPPRTAEAFSQPSDNTMLSSHKEKIHQPETNVDHLQREITLLRNDLNFERWHKAQYSEHISQIMRRNVKAATQEAETLNLINANRALKKQLEQVRKAREATVKDSVLTRKQASTLEANLLERFSKFKQEQETWQADAKELRRLRSETQQYRDLLVATEARELNKSHKLEIAQRDLEQLQKVQSQLQQAQRRLRELEFRQFEFESASRQRDILQKENEHLQAQLALHDDHRKRWQHIPPSNIARPKNEGSAGRHRQWSVGGSASEPSSYQFSSPIGLSPAAPTANAVMIGQASRTPIETSAHQASSPPSSEPPSRASTLSRSTDLHTETTQRPASSQSSESTEVNKERTLVDGAKKVAGRGGAKSPQLFRRNTTNSDSTSAKKSGGSSSLRNVL